MDDKPTFDGEMILGGPYDGLLVLPLANCMAESSWDYPSFVMTLGLDHAYDGEIPMHPDIADATAIADAIGLTDNDDRKKFILAFPLGWDT